MSACMLLNNGFSVYLYSNMILCTYNYPFFKLASVGLAQAYPNKT